MRYIGPISRFTGNVGKSSKRYDLLVCLSGPEPQRTIFEELVIPQLKLNGLKTIVVRGTLDTDNQKAQNDIIVHSHLETKKMEKEVKKKILSH